MIVGSAAIGLAFTGIAIGISLAAEKTIWDHVYSQAQADRGKVVYSQKCAACHLESVGGTNTASPLVGDSLLEMWSDKTIRNLYTRIRTTMPDDDPGSLTEQETVDIIAYVIAKNGCPAGEVELEPSAQSLASIKLSRRGIR
jgi:cytochrome c